MGDYRGHRVRRGALKQNHRARYLAAVIAAFIGVSTVAAAVTAAATWVLTRHG